MNEDGLYLNGVWVAEVNTALTFQANDISKPDSIQSSYALTFSLPDTMGIRNLLENAEQIDAGGIYPYATLKAKLIQDGEQIFSGNARLQSFKGGWSVDLSQASKGLLDQLSDKSLRSLNLSRFDHAWTIAGITALAGKSSGVVYPVIDYGAFSTDIFASDALFPSVYALTLIRQMLSESGYTPVGNWLQDELIKKLAVPFVDDTPQARDPEWVDDRKARVTVANVQQLATPEQTSAPKINLIIPFTVDDQDPLFTDGKLNNFKPELNAYVCDVAMRLRVQAYQEFIVSVLHGGMEAMLIIEKNGINVKQEYFSASGPYNVSGTAVDNLSLDELIDCRAGDQLRIRFVYQKRTLLSGFLSTVALTPETTWAEFVPDATIRPGDNWLVARNLPELSCKDLLKSVALFTSSTIMVDDFRKTLMLVGLDEIVNNTEYALDWSAKVDESQEPELSVTLSPYGQSNYVRWKEFDFKTELSKTSKTTTDTTKITPRPLQFGDGRILTSAANLPSFAELFELPFAGVQNSQESLSGYGVMLLIRTRRLTGSGDNITVERQSTTPRLILIEPTKTIITKANLVTPEGVVRDEAVTLTGCWWGMRSPGATTSANKFTLAFDRVDTFQREQTLIARYFNGLKRILRRPRSLTLSMNLSSEDIATLDLTLPIKLSQVRIGSLDISTCFLYLNKISNFIGETPTVVTLVVYY